jgi:hypothetical protein
VCTYLTESVEIDGSGKAPAGWIPLTDAIVYIDHPTHAPYDHTVNIDFRNATMGPAARVAVELTEEAALALVEAIQSALRSAPPGLASAHRA